MSKLGVTTTKRGDWDVVTFSGPFAENLGATLAPFVLKLGSKVIYNMRDVGPINSHGIRDWILFHASFEKTRQIVFEECSPAVVTQMNMIPGFFGSATIRSVYAPFSCASCRLLTLVKFEGPPFPTSTASVPARQCDHCSGEAHIADNVVEYFDFANP